MTEKQTRLEKIEEKKQEAARSLLMETESPKSNTRTPIVLKEEIMVENIPIVEKYVTKTYLVKDILVGKR